VGIDIEEERLAEARRRWTNTDDVTFHVQDIEDSTFPDALFDGILLNEVLEHVPSEEQTLAEVWRLLVDGGYLCVFSPNRWFPFEGHRLIVGSRELRPPVPVVPWLPRRATQRYMVARNYWPRELRTLVTDAGFETVYIGSAFPRFGTYKWLPESLIPAWRAAIPRLETLPLVRRFGVSTLVVARKISAAAGSPSGSAVGSS
jgi:ubiquinone/menaquinone biosynthesis C-methylase UbiE